MAGLERAGGELGNLANFVVSLLVRAKFTNVFTFSCSALECPEPIVVVAGGFVREVRQVEEERGAVCVAVRVVRGVAADAESVACACERALRGAAWEGGADAGQYRVVGLDTAAPEMELQDSSGRWVCRFEVVLTVARCI